MITDLELDILECEVKLAFESITTSKASGGDGIPVELFQILKNDAVEELHSICQQIWKTQQWPRAGKGGLFLVATAEFSKFAGILSAALSQHHLLGFEIAHLEFHHLQ